MITRRTIAQGGSGQGIGLCRPGGHNGSRFRPAWALRATVIDTAATIGIRNHEESYREARANAEKAIALDPGSAAGYVALAWIKISYEWDWHGASDDLKKAADLQPGSAVILSYRAYLYECLISGG